MLSFKNTTTLAAGLAASLIVAAPVFTAAPAHAAVGIGIEIGPDRGPPPLRREFRPHRPHPGWAWRAGRWDWADGRYVWVGGLWVEPPRARVAWIPGHWAHRGRHWVWIDGHWA